MDRLFCSALTFCWDKIAGGQVVPFSTDFLLGTDGRWKVVLFGSDFLLGTDSRCFVFFWEQMAGGRAVLFSSDFLLGSDNRWTGCSVQL